MLHHFRCNSAFFNYCAVLCKITCKNCDTAISRERIFKLTNDYSVSIRCFCNSVCNSAVYRKCICINHTASCKLFNNCLNTANVVEVCNKYR